MNERLVSYKKMMTGLVLGSAVTLSACSDNDNKPVPMPEAPVSNVEFQITVKNLTAGQPLSPAAIILHDNMWHSFNIGQAASTELEQLAEGGDNSHLLSASLAEARVYAAESGMGIIAPGQHESFQVETNENYLGTLSLSVLSMLVNSNDAIVALNGKPLGSLEVNESTSFELLTYDTGTEANTESADTIPGPAADGGNREGYNSERDDLHDAVYVHAGVVTQDDGLTTSTLSEIHRWDNPAALVRVERIR